MKGYIQVYTGNGKGKTTAALGLAIRAAGAGYKVYIAQFIKMSEYSEIKALDRFKDLITVEQFGTGRFIRGLPSDSDIKTAQAGIKKIKKILSAGQHQVVILEEANVAAGIGLFPVEVLLEIMDEKPENIELVITGRGADPRVIEKSDLVTEMKEVKYYFRKGVAARIGIEK